MSDREQSTSPTNMDVDRDQSASPRPAKDENSRSRSNSPEPERRESTGEPKDNPGNNLYVASLPTRAKQSDLEELFSKYGRLEKCQVIQDPVTRESRGFGFVTFEDTRDAEDAVKELNGAEVLGRRIRVEHAKRKNGHPKTPGQYLGPKQASSRYGGNRNRRRSRSKDRGRRGRSRSGDRSRTRDRSRSRDKHNDDRRKNDRRNDDRGRERRDRDRDSGRRR